MTSVQAPLTARHFPLRASHAAENSSTVPAALHYAPSSRTESPVTSGPSQHIASSSTARMTTPLAAPPPPPLYMSSHEHAPGPERQIRYAGADHTLGPTFSEEEDGDDSAFIASKMAALGLDPNGVPYSQGGFAASVDSRAARNGRSRPTASHSQGLTQSAQRQAQLQQLSQLQQAQQQQALFQLLSHQNGQHQLREAMALLELQQAQQAAAERQARSQAFAQHQAQQAFFAAQSQPGFDRRVVMQQQQQQQLQQDQYLQQLHLQQQLAALQPQAISHASTQRNFLAAQMQANLQARTGRIAQTKGISLDDAELRARFEAASEPLVTPPADNKFRFDHHSTGAYTAFGTASTSPSSSDGPTSPSWGPAESPPPVKSIVPIGDSATETTSSIKSPKGGRFAQARQEMAAAGDVSFGSLTSSLPKRSASDDQATIPHSNVTIKPIEVASPQDRNTAKYTPFGLGHGRPTTLASLSGTRSATASAVVSDKLSVRQQARSASQPAPAPQTKMYVVRQPLGPPGEAKDLGEKNFQSRMRRQAGLNLGMLGRRTESPIGTPVIA